MSESGSEPNAPLAAHVGNLAEKRQWQKILVIGN